MVFLDEEDLQRRGRWSTDVAVALRSLLEEEDATSTSGAGDVCFLDELLRLDVDEDDD